MEPLAWMQFRGKAQSACLELTFNVFSTRVVFVVFCFFSLSLSLFLG
jgi:hypothetical protein